MKKKYFTQMMTFMICGIMLANTVAVPVLAEETEITADVGAEESSAETAEGKEETAASQETVISQEKELSDGAEINTQGETSEEEIADGQAALTSKAEEESLEADFFTDSPEAAGDSEVLQGTCGEEGSASVTWKLENGEMTISGTGAMEYYGTMVDGSTGEVLEETIQPWKEYCSQITSLVIEEGVTGLGMYAFTGCGNLKSVKLSDTVELIGYGTFLGCSSLTDIQFGSGVTTLVANAFNHVAATSLVLPTALSNVDPSAFSEMNNLVSLYMEGSGYYKTVDGVLFTADGTKLIYCPEGRTGTYTVPEGTKVIGELAFSNSRLSEVIVPAGTEIEEYAFENSSAKVTVLSDNSNDSINSDNTENGKTEESSSTDLVKMSITVHENYAKAFEVLDLVNKERAAAGLSALTMDQNLLETAMLRAAEIVLYFDHTRPSGELCFTANSMMAGENIAWGATTAAAVMDMWMNSSGHKANILGEYTSIGVGCVNVNGSYYWVQCFGGSLSAKAERSAYTDRDITREVEVKKNSEYYQSAVNALESINGTIKVTFKGNGGTTSEKSMTVTKNMKFGELPAASRKGYLFSGWYTKKKGGTKITASSKVTVSKNMTLYAHWKKISLSKAALKKTSNVKGRKLSVKIKKVKGASGYQIQYALNSSFTKGKKSITVTGDTKTITGLKKGKTYYVRVRAYRKDSAGKKIYGSFSTVKKVKIKK